MSCGCGGNCKCKTDEWQFWTRKLVEADNKRREADREFQMVMMRLRGLTPGGNPITPEETDGE